MESGDDTDPEGKREKIYGGGFRQTSFSLNRRRDFRSRSKGFLEELADLKSEAAKNYTLEESYDAVSKKDLIYPTEFGRSLLGSIFVVPNYHPVRGESSSD